MGNKIIALLVLIGFGVLFLLSLKVTKNRCSEETWLEESSDNRESIRVKRTFKDTFENWLSLRYDRLKVDSTNQMFHSKYCIMSSRENKALLFHSNYVPSENSYYESHVVSCEKLHGNWHFYWLGNLTQITFVDTTYTKSHFDQEHNKKLAIKILCDGVLKQNCKTNEKFLRKIWFPDWVSEKHAKRFWGNR
ncbi:MAG: hypothetical protein KDC92_15540 [Bacteroidetes bacterium]|nr:hypothetical protein [Bacteroidota bacterium]